MNALLFYCVLDRDMFQNAPWELIRPIPVLDLTLEPSHHDCPQLSWIWIHRSGEALIIKEFQKCRKAFCIPVVGSSRKKELVLEVFSDLTHRLRALGVEGKVAGTA